MVRRVRSRVRAWARARDLEAEIEAELRFHLEMQTAENIRAGMSPAEARDCVLRAFGGVAHHAEAIRDQRTTFLDVALQDLRHAARGLKRTPGFTITAVLILTIAIAANTALFAVVDGVLLRPLRLPSPDRLVMLRMATVDAPGDTFLSGPDFAACVKGAGHSMPLQP